MRIGIISDTHGLLRPQVFEQFEGVDHILHAGDVGSVDLLIELEAIAPVTAVSGNTDDMEVRARVPETATLTLGGVRVVVLHGHQFGSPTPARVAAAHPEAGLIVFGHTHEPLIDRVGSTLVVNPGSAGRRRFRQPVSLAIGSIAEEAGEGHPRERGRPGVADQAPDSRTGGGGPARIEVSLINLLPEET